MRKLSRYGYRVAGAASVVMSMAGVAFLVFTDARVEGSVVARPLGWLVPVVVASVIATVGWLLLAQCGYERSDRTALGTAHCPACDREVLGNWRMCPYCGGMLVSAPPVSGGPEAAEQ